MSISVIARKMHPSKHICLIILWFLLKLLLCTDALNYVANQWGLSSLKRKLLIAAFLFSSASFVILHLHHYYEVSWNCIADIKTNVILSIYLYRLFCCFVFIIKKILMQSCVYWENNLQFILVKNDWWSAWI